MVSNQVIHSFLLGPPGSLTFLASLLHTQMGSGQGLGPSTEHQILPSQEDFSYLANFSQHLMEEELDTFSRDTRWASITLALGKADLQDALCSYRTRKEKHRLEENVCILTLQQDR